MRILEEPVAEWTQVFTCTKCETVFEADESDLQGDKFKKRGTYWFDGSADAAGLTWRLFVQCPNKCDIYFADNVPTRMNLKLQKTAR